jgi:hypothetical protein
LRNDARNKTCEDEGSSPHFIDKVGSDSGKDKIGGSCSKRDPGLRQGRGNADGL